MAERPSPWLHELTWYEVEAYLREDEIILLPIGSTEQHGPAGALGLDTYVAIAIVEDAARRTGVLAAPPLWFGDSSHHLGFPGTISLRTETLIAVVSDVARSLARHGFRKIVFVNGHKGANLPALHTATKNLHEFELPGVLFAVADPLQLARGVAAELKEEPEHHCGELEISHVWYKFPHAVRPDRLTGENVDFEPLFGGFVSPDLFGKGGELYIPWSGTEQRAFAPTGSFTASARASREKGRRYHEHMVNRLAAFIEWLRAYRGPIGAGGGPSGPEGASGEGRSRD